MRRRATVWLVLFALAAPVLWARDARSQTLQRTVQTLDAAKAGIGRTLANLQVTPLEGAAVSFDGLLAGKRGLALVMTSAECPVARRYAPRVAALETALEGRIAFLYINTVDSETTETMRAAIRDFGLRAPYATDPRGEIRRELRPRTTTEVFVLDGSRRLIYRGAVDDQYRVGGAASGPSRSLLREALDAVVSGRSPEVQATVAPGCLVDIPEEAPTDKAKPDATGALAYYPRVSKIIADHCLDCHVRGGSAPFSLASPGSVQGRAAMIEAVLRDGLMPPNHGLRADAAAPLVRDRAMPPEDRETLIAWLRSSRPIGDAPVVVEQPVVSNTWGIGRPDLVLTTPALTLSADGPLQHARYLVPVNLEADRWVDSLECRPVMHGSVEHALVWLVAPGSEVPLPGAMPPGPELLTTYSPSDATVSLPAGSARRLPTGSLLVVDLFARPMGKVGSGQLRIAMKFAPQPPDPAHEVRSMIVCAGPFALTAGAAEGRIEARTTLDAAARIVSLQPYMRTRGHEFIIEATEPGSPPRTLLSLGRFDARWQIRYPLRKPIVLAAGTLLVIRGVFDNSGANPANPDHERTVQMGSGADDEALMVSIELETP